MDEDEVVRMTEQDIALVREIVRWRRNHGVQFYRWPMKSFGRFSEWHVYRGKKRVNVAFDSAGISADRDYYGDGRVDIPSGTVTETVDCLVAFGFLPPRFSSAYRRGWDASALWNSLDPNNPVQVLRHNALFHDPENVSFPAVEVAW